MIYAAVRAKGWITVKPVFSGEEYNLKPDSFQINYTCHYLTDEIDFTARFELSGNQDSSLVLKMEGIANKSFLKTGSVFVSFIQLRIVQVKIAL